jgi:predicted nucleic acid-binding protein
MLKLVWDTSALVNIKEPNNDGYSPGHSLWKDLADGWIPGPYQNIIPAISVFEISSAVSVKLKVGTKILREFYIMGDNEILYPIDQKLLYASSEIVASEGFEKLRGADLIFACIAKIEEACLITLDNHFDNVADKITVINLNDSREEPRYRRRFPLPPQL